MAMVALSTRSHREDAGATVPDQQMRVLSPRYPVDRYMVESSNKFEIVNILDDDIWHTEPALRPEDEIILRKLHEMLQSTADDLKTLSGELSKFHQPGVQVKTQPTPLDEDFNEKVHIKELVNAKFHGHKIVEPLTSSVSKPTEDSIKHKLNNLRKVESPPIMKENSTQILKPVSNKKLSITRPRLLQIKETNVKDHNIHPANIMEKPANNAPTVVYNEFSYKYEENPEIKINQAKTKNLKIQDMPRINIRSELKEQKVLQLDIFPEAKESSHSNVCKPNVAVLAIEHETMEHKQMNKSKSTVINEQYSQASYMNKKPIRKISKMSTCESSGSSNNNSSDMQQKLRHAIRTTKISPKTSARTDTSKNRSNNIPKKKEVQKRPHFSLDEWKRKLNMVYGRPSSSKSNKGKSSAKKASVREKNLHFLNKPVSLNDAEYIPYSQLTLGGARVSDIEQEISEIPNRQDLPLSPILDKILASKDNSTYNEYFKKENNNKKSQILSTSDENLLQEVIDIEKTVNHTISKNMKKISQHCSPRVDNGDEASEHDSYSGDFEDEKSDNSENPKDILKLNTVSDSESNDDKSAKDSGSNYDLPKINLNKTYTKVPNLSFKNSVDVFEYVHSVDTQDSGTQSNTVHKISLKETQTSPTTDTPNVQPIYNELRPPFDPEGEVEKMFKIEKDFIKRLIIAEYGDLLEKSISKPSTSKDDNEQLKDKNIYSFQKNTQTSPARAKSVMTSPTMTKTRTTSPFLSVTVDHQTSPNMVVVTNDKELNVTINDDDDGISINMSSPRFSLRLPQTSREVLSNLEVASQATAQIKTSKKSAKNKDSKTDGRQIKPRESSTSVDADKSSSSEISSLGEIKLKLKRRMKKLRELTISESSSSSSLSKYSSELETGILPLMRSEGEVSVEQQVKKVNNNKSEGETSYGQV